MGELELNANAYLPLRDVVFNTLREAICDSLQKISHMFCQSMQIFPVDGPKLCIDIGVYGMLVKFFKFCEWDILKCRWRGHDFNVIIFQRLPKTAMAIWLSWARTRRISSYRISPLSGKAVICSIALTIVSYKSCAVWLTLFFYIKKAEPLQKIVRLENYCVILLSSQLLFCNILWLIEVFIGIFLSRMSEFDYINCFNFMHWNVI